jgi:hypothetical protein
MAPPPVTLQISLAPSDFAHAQHILPHQVRAWRGQYSELLLTIDFHRSRGRFGDDWEQGRDKIVSLASSIPNARVVSVDYSVEAQRRVAAEFFAGEPIPTKDHRGGPFYSYFFALAEARHDYVFHLDSDLFFGGGSPTWMTEAIAMLGKNRDVLVVAPLAGPPHPEGKLLTLNATPELEPWSFRFEDLSTRLFLMSRHRFRERIGYLRTQRPGSLRARVVALLDRHPVQELPENLFSIAMRRAGLFRRDFLGAAPGMWSLHPSYRCAEFYRRLPALVQSCESGEIPASQRGCNDFNDDMVDWREARATMRTNRVWRRVWRRLLTRQ